MSQISPPIRIVLVAAVAFLAAWMFFLRPKSEEIPPPAPAATTAPAKQPGTTAQSAAGKAVQAAENAKATAENAAKVHGGETAATPAATAAPGAAAAKPAATAAETLGIDPEALATLPRGVRKALEARKIVVLGFFNHDALDDRATRRQFKKVWTFHGRASLHTASINNVQRYQVITRGVDVAQSPSIVVIDRDRKAQLLTGYVDHMVVEQAIIDAMRRSGMAVIKSPYLRHVNRICGTAAGALKVSIEPGLGANPRGYVRDNVRNVDRFLARVKGTKAPKDLRAFKSGTVADLALYSQAFHGLYSAVKAKSATRVNAVLDKYGKPLDAADKRFDKRARQHDMLACLYG